MADARVAAGNGSGRRWSRLAAGMAACAVSACCLPGIASADSSSPDLSGALGGAPYATGLVPTPSPAASPGAIAGLQAQASSLPASVSLTGDAMPVGNQGDVGSCAAWSTDYTALGYWENKEGIAGGGLEPMYTYSQVDGGVDDGSSIEANLQIDEQQGIDTRADYFQGDFDYTDQPTAAEKANAVNWKLSTFSDLAINPSAGSTVTQQSIEVALAAGDPVTIGIPVYDNFFYVTSANSGYYASPSGGLAGYHAITALGYNAQGLVIENSWGTGWGNAGYATLSWAFVNQYVFDAVEVGPLVTGQPVSTTVPAVTGTARQGQTLTASTGNWSPAATSYAYQWQREASTSSTWTAISGATSSKYVPVAADLGDSLRVVVTATDAKGSGSAAAAKVGPVLTGAPVAASAPAVTGTDRVGQTLTATAGTWSPAATSYAYQWQRSANGGSSWTSISGATASTHVTVAADAEDDVRVLVTASNAYGAGAAMPSALVGPISGQPYNTAAPGLSGTPVEGDTLTATVGTWNPAGTTYAYQWQREITGGQWVSVSSMTNPTYVLEPSDVGTSVRVQVAATNSDGTTYAWTTLGPIKSGVPALSAAPVIAGTAARGTALTVSAGSWSPAATSYAYQWQHSANGSTWTSITGATGTSYTPAVSDEKTELRVQVTAGNAFGSATATSAATAAVKATPPADSTAPTVSGTAKVGDKLTAAVGTWTGEANTVTYQWQHSANGSTWTSITGATGSTYAPAASDSGDQLRVVVTVTNVDGAVSASSAATAKVTSTAAVAATAKAKPASRSLAVR